MPPTVASAIFAISIAGLFLLDRDKKSGVSKFLWIPTAWMFFCLSRSVSEWLGVNPAGDLASSYMEGSPLDAAVFEALEIAALIVVLIRQQQVGSILRRNGATLLFFGYAALSSLWSDYSFVTLKHWIKGIGDVMMILIILTEPSVPDAIKRLFTRLGFVLVPLSILFIRYYPQLGRVINLSWTMEPVGVATQKNGLGALCAVVGVVFIWRFRSAYNDRDDPKRKRHLLALGSVLAMTAWLLWTCNSMTSICAIGMASIVMLLSTKPAFRRNRALLHLLVVGLVSITVYGLFFQDSGSLLQSMGRNPTLTGRTEAWPVLLRHVNNPLVGVGYESFWLGSRLQRVWAEPAFAGFHINEAHSGYVETLLTLGWIGEVLLGILIATGYRHIIRQYHRDPDIASLKMALLLSVVVGGFTEAAFRFNGPRWLVFLLAILDVPAYAARVSGHSASLGRRFSRARSEPDVIREHAPVGY